MKWCGPSLDRTKSIICISLSPFLGRLPGVKSTVDPFLDKTGEIERGTTATRGVSARTSRPATRATSTTRRDELRPAGRSREERPRRHGRHDEPRRGGRRRLVATLSAVPVRPLTHEDVSGRVRRRQTSAVPLASLASPRHVATLRHALPACSRSRSAPRLTCSPCATRRPCERRPVAQGACSRGAASRYPLGVARAGSLMLLPASRPLCWSIYRCAKMCSISSPSLHCLRSTYRPSRRSFSSATP